MGLIRFLYQKKSFILLCFLIYILIWLNAGNVKEPTIHYDILQSNSTFSSILNHISKLKINLLLIDPYVLDHLFVRKIPFDRLKKQLITFAITDESTDKLFDYFQELKFSIKISKNILSDEKISIDHIFIEYEQKIIHLAVLHDHNSYYLIEKNTLPLFDHIRLAYGDVLRAVEHVETELYENSFHYPRNVGHFLWLYKISEFLYCNRALADEMESKYHLYQNASQLNLTVIPMTNIAHGLDQLEKRYWLAGGTLLGWYRHCGLIPFTQDADFGLFAEEYDESIRNHFLGNSITYLWGALGLVNDSLEFRLYTGRYTLDLFWAYRTGDERWCGYQVYRLKYRRILPLLPKLCSGDLFGHRFTLPCTPVDYLDREYGVGRWQSPVEKGYAWVNMKYHSKWDDISWMYATRLYTRDGKLRTDQFAIDWISKHFNYSIETIPSFINALPDEPVTLPPLKTKLIYGPPPKSTKKKPRKKSN